MKHNIRGIAHISHIPRPMGAMINNPKPMADHGNKS